VDCKLRTTVFPIICADGTMEFKPSAIVKGCKMTLWSDLKKHRVIHYRGDKIIQKEFKEGVLYTNARGWMTSRIFVQELKRFSKFLEKARPNKKCLLWLDNFSAHLNIDLNSLGIRNLRLEYYRANCTGLFQPCDMLLFCNLKQRYRSWLLNFRQETQKPSPGLQIGTKKILELLTSTNFNVLQGCWKRTGVKRFASHQDSDIADEEATIITMMEELELDHERAKDQEEEKEQEEEVVVVEIPKPSKKPTDKGKEKKKKEVQFKLTAFFKNK